MDTSIEVEFQQENGYVETVMFPNLSALRDVFKSINLNNKGLHVNRKCSDHLRR